MSGNQTCNSVITRRELLKYGLLGGFTAGLSSSVWLSGCSRKSKKKRPNVIFILIDALRADRLGSYGHLGGYTPALDSIAREAVFFERMIAPAPWTQPSMASIFCSRYAGVHKVTDYQLALETTKENPALVAVLNESFKTLAEVFEEADYETAAFVANPFILREFGFAQGFSHFDSSFAGNTTPGSKVNKTMLTWLDGRNNERPFFCFLHYMDVHGPYNAGPKYLDPLLERVDKLPDKRKLTSAEGKRLNYLNRLPPVITDRQQHERLGKFLEYWIARYEAGVIEMDHYIGQLKSSLQVQGLWDNSLVIVTADHGESLLENGYWDHGLTLGHPELQVPFFLRWPKKLPPKRIGSTCRLIDLMPTLIDLLELPKSDGLQGVSLSSEISGKSSKERIAFAEAVKLGPEQKAIYKGDWKLIITPSASKMKLYNVTDDPLEQDELSLSFASKVTLLLEILQKQVAVNKKLSADISRKEVLLSPEQADRLRSLGYVE